MPDARRLLADALTQLDAALPLESYDVSKAIEPAAKAAKESGETVDELQFELIATYLELEDEPTDWGTFYGPRMSSVTKDGQRVDSPPLESITPECIAYWSARMNAAQHHALRARYGDLVWDFTYTVTGKKPLINAAHIAIDGYVDALNAYPQLPFHSWGDIARRMVDLALSVNDDVRLRKSVAAIIAHANTEVDTEEHAFRQQSLFALLKSIPPKRCPQGEFQAVINGFRCRVEKLDVAGVDQFEMAPYALPLADHYWSSRQQNEAKAVMRIYRTAVERMAAKTTMAILAVGWLHQLYGLLLRYEMNAEAKEILKRIEDLQPRVPKELVPIVTSESISQEEIDQWLNWLVTSDVDESIVNVTCHFVPHLDDLRRQIYDLKKDFPLSQTFATTYVDHKGRAVSNIAPDDTEGKLIWQMHQDIQFRNTFLELALRHLFKKHSVGHDELFARIIASPVWHEQRHPILRRGIEAYFAGDPIVAIHILVTDIENAVRTIAGGLGLPLQKSNRMGGFDFKNLSDFLADETVTAFLTEDVAAYLRVVLTDRRGWNLRNGTSHGILPATSFTQAASQRLLHIVLLLSTLRKIEPIPQATDQPDNTSSSPLAPPAGGE